MRIVALDTTEQDAPWLSLWWTLGSLISGADVVVRAASWSEAYDGIGAALASERIPSSLDLQVWGHGAPAKPLIAGRRVSLLDLASVVGRPVPGSTVWWRSCDVHREVVGQRFAEDTCETVGLASVGHCAVISAPNPLRQREICGLRPGEAAWWPPSGEGLPGCSTLRMAVPAFAWRP